MLIVIFALIYSNLLVRNSYKTCHGSDSKIYLVSPGFKNVTISCFYFILRLFSNYSQLLLSVVEKH